jgi:hypothetical protein
MQDPMFNISRSTAADMRSGSGKVTPRPLSDICLKPSPAAAFAPAEFSSVVTPMTIALPRYAATMSGLPTPQRHSAVPCGSRSFRLLTRLADAYPADGLTDNMNSLHAAYLTSRFG